MKMQLFFSALILLICSSELFAQSYMELSKKDLQTPDNVVVLKSPSHFSDLLDEIESFLETSSQE
jgi:hypothetical protein